MSLYDTGLIWLCLAPLFAAIAVVLAIVNKKEDEQMMEDE